jgi:hypothetical protein
MRPVKCQNKRCNNARPIGYEMLGPGSIASYPCRHCGTKTVIIGKNWPHWA